MCKILKKKQVKEGFVILFLTITKNAWIQVDNYLNNKPNNNHVIWDYCMRPARKQKKDD